jgi:hypothetical protein
MNCAAAAKSTSSLSVMRSDIRLLSSAKNTSSSSISTSIFSSFSFAAFWCAADALRLENTAAAAMGGCDL